MHGVLVGELAYGEGLSGSDPLVVAVPPVGRGDAEGAHGHLVPDPAASKEAVLERHVAAKLDLNIRAHHISCGGESSACQWLVLELVVPVSLLLE